jgi:hypothetical protein
VPTGRRGPEARVAAVVQLEEPEERATVRQERMFARALCGGSGPVVAKPGEFRPCWWYFF